MGMSPNRARVVVMGFRDNARDLRRMAENARTTDTELYLKERADRLDEQADRVKKEAGL